MDQITITREEFKKKINENPEGYGILRAMRKDPEMMKGHEQRALLEELIQAIIFLEIENDLFGPKE